MLASYTPSLVDLYLLYGDPAKASIVLGVILAAILLIYGVIAFYVKFIKHW